MSFFRNPQSGTYRLRSLLIGLFLPPCVLVFLLFKGSNQENFLSQEGFVSPQAPLLMIDSEMGLREEQDFIVMNLSPAQAATLMAKFKTQSRFYSGVTPSSMPPTQTPNALWKPQTVKKYRSGSFERKTGTYDYYCQYVLDVTKPGVNVLYFYANSPFYD